MGGGGRERLSELRNCVKVEVDVLGSLFLIVRTVSSVDVNNNEKERKQKKGRRRREGESREGGCSEIYIEGE